MNKLIISFVFLIFLTTLTASKVIACSCAFITEGISIERQVKDAYKNSSAVFIGEVSEIVSKPDVYYVLVKFKTEKSWSRNVQKEITISTGRGSGDCGYEFVVGKKYLVYAYGEDKLETNICTRTDIAESNKDISVLNKLKKIKAKSSPK
jgi:hypothetical protein